MMELPTSALVWIGALVITVLTMIIKKWFDKSLSKMFERFDEIQDEKEEDTYLLLKGQQVIGDNLHELNYAVLNGTHNGGLQKANDELDEYRDMLNDNLTHKASKYSTKRK